MEEAPRLPDDAARVAAIDNLRMLDKKPERSWDRLAELASVVCGTPIALVSIVADTTQEFKARVGLDADHTGRAESFCAHAIVEHKLFQISDAKNDVRFHDNPLVTGDPKIRFYAGMPVRMPDGQHLGTLCVIDQNPRTLTDAQERALKLLAQHAEELLIARAAALQLRQMARDVSAANLQATVNDISHEVGTPLTPILNHLHLLKKEALGEDAMHHLESIEDNVRRLVAGLREIGSRFAKLPDEPRSDSEAA